jgi:hypothetical protein
MIYHIDGIFPFDASYGPSDDISQFAVREIREEYWKWWGNKKFYYAYEFVKKDLYHSDALIWNL